MIKNWICINFLNTKSHLSNDHILWMKSNIGERYFSNSNPDGIWEYPFAGTILFKYKKDAFLFWLTWGYP